MYVLCQCTPIVDCKVIPRDGSGIILCFASAVSFTSVVVDDHTDRSGRLVRTCLPGQRHVLEHQLPAVPKRNVQQRHWCCQCVHMCTLWRRLVRVVCWCSCLQRVSSWNVWKYNGRDIAVDWLRRMYASYLTRSHLGMRVRWFGGRQEQVGNIRWRRVRFEGY